MSEETQKHEEAPEGASNTGSIQGVPGPVIKNVGTVDLRGASDAELARLERVENVGALLIAPGTLGKLQGVTLINVGSTIEASPKDQFLTGPMLDFDQAALSAMPDNQRLIVTGIVAFAEDIDPALIAQKFEHLHLTGVLIAPSAVRGALTGRMNHNGPSVASIPTPGGKVHNLGDRTATAGYVRYLNDGVGYFNLGRTEFAADVPVALVEQKIAAYFNLGLTVASQDVLDYLQARCAANLGAFQLRGGGEDA